MLAREQAAGRGIARLKVIEAEMTDPDRLLIAWGLDPIYYTGGRLAASHLDQVSATRPIFVHHANGHVATVNSATMRMAGIKRDGQVVGVLKGADGEPNGELVEFAAMFLVEPALTRVMGAMGAEKGIRDFGVLANRTGHTTVTELGTAPLYDPKGAAVWQKVGGLAYTSGHPRR
jgi:predicted amidohydrolase YtcJ